MKTSDFWHMSHCGLVRTIYRSFEETNCIFTCFPPRHILLASLNTKYSAPIPNQPPTNGSLYFSLAFTERLIPLPWRWKQGVYPKRPQISTRYHHASKDLLLCL